jgi:hypothetical protein
MTETSEAAAKPTSPIAEAVDRESAREKLAAREVARGMFRSGRR